MRHSGERHYSRKFVGRTQKRPTTRREYEYKVTLTGVGLKLTNVLLMHNRQKLTKRSIVFVMSLTLHRPMAPDLTDDHLPPKQSLKRH